MKNTIVKSEENIKIAFSLFSNIFLPAAAFCVVLSRKKIQQILLWKHHKSHESPNALNYLQDDIKYNWTFGM